MCAKRSRTEDGADFDWIQITFAAAIVGLLWQIVLEAD